ncbi:hypothetical protein WDU94_011970 [Cyamophila willieti]
MDYGISKFMNLGIPSRCYLLRDNSGQDDLDDSILQKEVIFPWQKGFFPDEVETSRRELDTGLDVSSFNSLAMNIFAPGTSNTSIQRHVQDMFITGTTTLGFIYPGGIILATDSRATAGELIVSQKLNKVIPVSSSILCTLAGNAADCVYWLGILKKECKSYEAKYHTRMQARHAANLLVNTVRKYRGGGSSTLSLTFGTLMASYEEGAGPQLYMLDNSGILIEGTKFCVGSGEEYARAILDTDYRPDMNEEDAYNLALNAIYHACRRDIHSGGFVRLYKINSEGWSQVLSKDVKDIYNERLVVPGGGDQ